jgi:pimeloyl-ACP methyl ester carboxylesterase
VVGHDWGAIVAWQLCLLRPDLVRALVNLSVVYHPRRPEMSPLQAIRAACGEDHYMCRFQVNKWSTLLPFPLHTATAAPMGQAGSINGLIYDD